MAIYQEDWSGSNIGQEPTGWTKRWNQTGAAWEVVDYPASPNGRALKVTRASSARALLTHDAASTEVKGRIEMRALVQLAPSYDSETPAAMLFVTRASGAAGSETGYGSGLAFDHPTIGVRSNIYNNGASTILGYAGDNAGLAPGDRCWIILIDDGSGGFQSSAYAEADTDLSTPLAVHTFTNTTLSADGWLGLFGFTGIASGAEYWEHVVFATNGDTLPAIGAPDPVITLISDQDSMNIDASSLVIENAETDTPTIKLTVRKTATTAYGDQPTWIHWYFGLSGVQGKRPIVEVEITDRWFSDDSYDPTWRPVISQDDHGTWDQFGSFTPLTTPARVRFQPAVALTADTVYLADHPPYRIAEFDALAATLAADVSGLVSPSAAATASGVIGTSPAEVDENARAIGGHDIYGFVLGDSRATTDGNPKRWMIVDTAIHPGEVIDGWPLEGLVDFYLNGTGALADQLRSNWKIGAYFALTPNGRFGGHWRSNFERQKDANRDWGDAGAFSLAESVIVRDAILADLDGAIPEVNLSLHTASSRNKTENVFRNTAIADQTKQNAWLDALDEKDAITWDRVDTNITSSLTGWHVARGTPIGVISEFGTRTASTVARYKQTGQRFLEATAQIDADGVFYSTPVVGMTVDSTLAPNQITLQMVYAAHSGFTDLSVSGNIVTIRPGVEVLSGESVVSEWWLPAGIVIDDVEQALQAKGAASYADSLIDLSGHTNATSIIAPGWTDAAGWQFNGSSHSIDTNLIVPSDQSWSVFIRFANTLNRSTGNYVFGQLKNATDGDVRIMAIIRPATPAVTVATGGSVSSYSEAAVYDGVVGFAGSVAYLDGTALSSSALGTALANLSMVIGATKAATSDLNNHYGGDVLAFAIYNTALSPSQVAELTASMAAL